MKKAIDIVILPSREVADASIKFSHLISDSTYTRLNKQNQLPHISLLMGGAEEDKITEIWSQTINILKDFQPFPIIINELRIMNTYSGLHIEKSEDLVRLHTNLVDRLVPQLNYNNDLSTLANPKNAQEKSLFWVNGYPENSAKENFNPHITLGDGKLNDLSQINLPIEFQATKIAICHLGNYCTCYEILEEFDLK